MHQQGKQMWTTHWRNGTLLGYLNRVEFWDFNFQQTTPKAVTILPGDRLNTHCIYFQNAGKSTKFSIASADEMCLEYVYYYPKMAGPFCAYAYSPDIARNLTLCLGQALGTGPLSNYPFNPTVIDPVGGEVVTFGAPNPASFVCSAPVSESQPGTVTSTLGVSESSNQQVVGGTAMMMVSVVTAALLLLLML